MRFERYFNAVSTPLNAFERRFNAFYRHSQANRHATRSYVATLAKSGGGISQVRLCAV